MAYFIFSVLLVVVFITFNYFVEKPSTKSEWALVIVLALVIGGVFHALNYFATPTFALNCCDIYVEMVLFAIAAIFIAYARTEELLDNPVIAGAFWGTITAVVLLLGAWLYTWDFFHTSKQQKLLNVENVVDIRTTDTVGTRVFSPIPVEKMCLNPAEVIKRKYLNQAGDLKNTYELGSLTKQSVTVHCNIETMDGKKIRLDYDNQLMYVGILEHEGFLTWAKHPWSPAYVLADAASGETYIVHKVNGEELKIKYTPGARLNCDLERHLRFNGYIDTILDDFNVEIDENGRPFAPVTTMKHIVGLSTRQVTGVAVVDIQTGDIKWYTPQNAPAFVNRIYPEDVVYERIKNWGEYPNGYFHWTNNAGLLQPCDGMDIVQTSNGCCYYVGIQAKTGTFDTEGYMLIDIRTGIATYYKRDGISETEAIRVLTTNTYKNISLQVNDSILYLTEPIYYNIEGMNTFFATFVANADKTIKYYAFCSADSKEVVGVGENLEEAKAAYIASYHKHIATSASKFQTADKRKEVSVTGNVLEKVQEGNAYYFRLEGQEDKTFYAYSSILPEVRWSASKIEITYNMTDSKTIAISSYKVVQ